MGYNQGIRRIIRKNFGKNRETLQIPNLIEVQRNSYKQFIEGKKGKKKRSANQADQTEQTEYEGLEKVFKSIFPVEDYQGRAYLEFVSYYLEEPKYYVEECQQRGLTYQSALKVQLRLDVFETDEETGSRSFKNSKEQTVFICDIPRMKDNGTFIINGTERVVVSQMHRSPGVLFDHDKGKTHASGKLLFNARVSPNRGSWMDIEFDHKDVIYTRIDRKRKFPVITLLKAIGLDDEAIVAEFYQQDVFTKTDKGWICPFVPEFWQRKKIEKGLINADGEVVFGPNKKLSVSKAKALLEQGLKNIIIEDNQLLGQYIAKDVVNFETGAIYAEAGNEIDEELLEKIQTENIDELAILRIDHINIGAFIVNTMAIDRNFDQTEALQEIHRIMRPGEPSSPQNAKEHFENMFFNKDKYDLSPVGRVKINMRLDLNFEEDVGTLQHEDIIACVKELVKLREGKSSSDDIDHMGNRRVRSVGELLENQFRLGLIRMEKTIKEKMMATDMETVMPQDLINSRVLHSAINEFFGTSQLSQFMDQTNPLAEITHKRRISALGPGGLNRERAGFEVRDVHTSHYGRVCPVETPEGPNIGLINSLATFARINKYGFIETAYNKVENGKVTDNSVYFSAIEEEKQYIASASEKIDENGCLQGELLLCRKAGEVQQVPKEQIGYIDVSPKQLVSVAASLIPFLENDDANRALMGSNMQRQAVPLIRCEAPMVGTGIESVVARDSGAAIVALNAGIVDQVDATRIVVRVGDSDISKSGVNIYNLKKFQRSNQNTCINQRPLVKVGDEVRQGEIIADGPATDNGDLALGRNVMVAFMPWNGYNFEDSILISEKIVQDDIFTSIHIEEFAIMARDTKLGPEEVTRDIPNIGEEGLRNLDEAGIVYVGAEVKAGDILVGKITPKGESPMTPEEKLLRAIFGEKASEVRNSSLHLPPGVSGTVIDVRVFNRYGVEKDERSISIDRQKIEKFTKDRDDERQIYDRNTYDKVEKLLDGQKIAAATQELEKGEIIDSDKLQKMSRSKWWNIGVENEELMDTLAVMKDKYDNAVQELDKHFIDKVDKLQQGDEMLPGVMKVVKIFVAVKRKLQPGDKMAGRHGNKGVVSKIVPIEDMPYMEDGTPVDIVLNPLGVPSRMNIGQILETHLGWAAAGMGKKIQQALEKYRKTDLNKIREQLTDIYEQKEVFENMNEEILIKFAQSVTKGIHNKTPVFDGANEADITAMLEKAGLDKSGQVRLYDGMSGVMFDRPVTVGFIYMLKLHHLVDEKIHSRSIGPYSLVTQQPLGGKAQFGGQRFGEMEVWALEAYGAAYTLQEMLTVKSDDVAGRTKVYEAIVRGDNNFEAGIPESFNVLLKEIRSLAIDIELHEDYSHKE